MAGGKGERMGGREKPLVTLKGKPLIDYVIAALINSSRIGHIYISVTPRTPKTWRYIGNKYRDESRVSAIMTPGTGYHEDTGHSVEKLALFRPFLIISSDIPLVRSETIDDIVRKYEITGAEALSVRLDCSCVPQEIRVDTILIDHGIENIPAAINIIDGRHMNRYQQEHVYIISDRLLAVNINYLQDLSACDSIMSESSLSR